MRRVPCRWRIVSAVAVVCGVLFAASAGLGPRRGRPRIGAQGLDRHLGVPRAQRGAERRARSSSTCSSRRSSRSPTCSCRSSRAGRSPSRPGTWPSPSPTDDGTFSDVVTQVTWSGGQIPPGGFDLFPVFGGPLPKNTNKLVFKALQTYSDGDVVRWIQTPVKGAPEPENPAPTLVLTKAAKGGWPPPRAISRPSAQLVPVFA